MTAIEIILVIIGLTLLVKQRSAQMILNDIVIENEQILKDLHRLQDEVNTLLTDHHAQISTLTATQASPEIIQSLIDGQSEIRKAVSAIDSLVNPPSSPSLQLAIHELPST